MEKIESNKLNSFRKVKGVLAKKASLFTGIPVYAGAREQFFSLMDEVEEVAKRTELDTTGETRKKKEIKEALSQLAISLASSGMMYAYDKGLTELSAALNYTYTDMAQSRDNETLKIAMAIEEELKTHAKGLEEYQVSEGDLQELNDLINQFRNSREIQGEVKSESVADTRQFKILMNTIDELLSQKIDRIVRRLKPDHPRFFDTYQNARMIVDL